MVNIDVPASVGTLPLKTQLPNFTPGENSWYTKQ